MVSASASRAGDIVITRESPALRYKYLQETRFQMLMFFQLGRPRLQNYLGDLVGMATRSESRSAFPAGDLCGIFMPLNALSIGKLTA
jgi:hypothetical protein